MDAVKSIYRPFHEMIEIFFACLIDKDFAEKYGNPNVMYDNNEFWRNNINGNKLDRYINRIFDELEYPKESKKEYFKRRDDSNKFLSETLHDSFNSTFSRSDIVGPDKMNYNHFMKAYDTVYDLYYQDLYKKADDIDEMLHALHEYFLELEEQENDLKKESNE